MKAAVGEVKCRRYNSLRLPHYGLRTGSEARALTLAFTTFVLFQFFNVQRAHCDGICLQPPLLRLSNALVLPHRCPRLQIIAVNWRPAQDLFNVTSLSLRDWALAACVASSSCLSTRRANLGPRFALNRADLIHCPTAAVSA